ncbi:MAG TPA: DUF4232 domain-containing protein [Acidimicrobiales bacterium]|nr:DUF4232 domain-containing protein [Acidimicrobiales bacterium]
MVVATVLGAVSIVLLASCSGASPKVGKSGSPSSSTTTATVAACSASSVSASVDFTTFGGSSTSPAGAVVFDNTSGNSCSLRGIPTIELVGADGQVIPSFPAPSSPAHDGTAVLTPGGKPAASSITWSSLTCLAGSYSLAVTFPGWSSSVPAGSTAGYQGPACTVTGTTVYVSPVELITAPSSTSSTTTTSG